MAEYLALYRKWRPAVFADVVGQDAVTKVLRGEIMSGSVSHAYLFLGSRGTGKTTCARILAKAVNCESPVGGDPCGECARCKAFDTTYDVIELDAASNNSVDDIRDLCDKVSFAPIEMKKRVYIIDEFHMLSAGAFNALLKTLEEPPSHVMFILATTELGKIPATILSRCKRFDFHRILPDAMIPRLRQIADTEHIGIGDDALRLISFLATGAMRDALSMLELFVGQTGIDREKAAAALGVVGNAPVLRLLTAIAEKDCASALTQLADIYNASKDMGVLFSELGDMFRDLLIMKYASGAVSRLLDVTDDVITTLRDAEDKFTKERLLYSLEITERTVSRLAHTGLSARMVAETGLIRLCDPRLDGSSDALLSRIADLEDQMFSGFSSLSAGGKPEIKFSVAPIKADAAVPKPIPQPEASQTGNVDFMAFGELVAEIQRKNPQLASFVAGGHGELTPDGGTVLLYVSRMGHFMLNDRADWREQIRMTCSRLLGSDVKLELLKEEASEKADNRSDLSGLQTE